MIDIQKIKNNIINYSNEKLCEMIVSNRYLNIDSGIDAVCMEELSQRRIAGSQFEFEQEIKKMANELPDLEFKLPDFKEIINQAKNFK